MAALLREADRARSPATAAGLRLNAAEALLLQSNAAAALNLLETLRDSALPEEQREDYHRALAGVYLATGRYAAAELEMSRVTRLAGPDYLTLGNICEQLSRYRCAADAYIQASIDIGYGDDALPPDLHNRIWRALSRAQQGPAAFTHRYHHAWWLLQQEYRDAGSITGQIAAWQRWQSRYPSHPARLDPPDALRRLQDYQVPQVALLLPLSGNLAAAGRAVRDGMIAAYLSEQASEKPRISIYDSAGEGLARTWERALAGGADVVVGPLLKGQVEQFAELTQYSAIPRLVLNYLDTAPARRQPPAPLGDAPTSTLPEPLPVATTGNSLFQIGIAIEDEAVSLANHVLAAGHEKLLVVHSQDRWARRALQALRAQWPYPLTEAAFVDIKGLTGAVGEAMQVAASETRKNEIANILGEPLEFLPRARGDLDGIIALTTQVEAEALVPALRFHFADELPVYATSQVTRGDNTARLAGFQLTEMPVFAAPNASHAALTNSFELDQNPYAELYALGFDAYRLATWLPILDAGTPVGVAAATGYLWLEPDGAFRRNLGMSKISREGLIPVAE